MYTPRWTELPRIFWRWSLLKVVHFGYQNHHQCQEAFHGEQLHPALRHGQYPLVWCSSCAVLFYHFLSILIGMKHLFYLTWCTHISTQKIRTTRIQFPDRKYKSWWSQPSCSTKKCSAYMATYSILATQFACYLLWRLQHAEGIYDWAVFAWQIQVIDWCGGS